MEERVGRLVRVQPAPPQLVDRAPGIEAGRELEAALLELLLDADPGARHERREEHKRGYGAPLRDERNREAGEGVPDDHDIALHALKRVDDHRRVVIERGVGVVRGQLRRDRPVPE